MFFAAKDLGEPREASRSLRRNNRVFGSLPRQTAPLTRSEAPSSDSLVQINQAPSSVFTFRDKTRCSRTASTPVTNSDTRCPDADTALGASPANHNWPQANRERKHTTANHHGEHATNEAQGRCG